MKSIILSILIACPAFGSGLTLTWKDNSNNEDGFKIERRILTPNESNAFEEIATVQPDVETFNDAEPESFPSTVFEYRIRAFNSFGNSEYSNTAASALESFRPPNAPSDFEFKIPSIIINAQNIIVNGANN